MRRSSASDLQDRFDRLSVFLPRHLVRQALEGGRSAGGASVLEGAFLFSDISGFTALSEKFAELGSEGAERIASEISRCFEPLLDIVEHRGGSVLRFGGDALLVYFAESEVGASGARAWAAATEIVRCVTRMRPVAAPKGPVKLGVKVGLHRGRILGFTADLEGGRNEYLTLGTDLNRLAECESVAERGQIVASPEFSKSVGIRPVNSSRPAAILPAPASVVRGRFNASSVFSVLKSAIRNPKSTIQFLSGFLPAAVAARHAILGERDEWLAEMRQITAMFVNVDGLGRLADQAVQKMERGGASSGRPILRRIESYLSGVASIVNLHGGFFFATDLYDHGDKIIVVFGAPVGLEREEERAIDAARDILNLPARLGIARCLRQRIGLNSGHAFCGLVGGRRRRAYTVMGDTVNTAARCMSASGWREVYAHENTYSRARGRFWGPRREFTAKGKSRPVIVYAVRGERRVAVSGGTEILIGREKERRRIETAVLSRKGFILNLTGEAGVGKSALLRFAANLWQSDGGRIISADCLPYGAQAPFFPWRRALWNFFNFGEDPLPAEVRRKLGDFTSSDAALLAEMIGVEIGVRPPELDPGEAVTRRFEIIRRVLGRDSRALWLFEDIHWMDSHSLELLRRLAVRPETPCKMVVTRRPEKNPFAQDSRVDLMALQPFDLKETGEMASRILGAGALSSEALANVHVKSTGNPFYLTEIFRLMLERGVDVKVPDSVGALLQSRVDLLPETEREVLRIAAVIGRSFYFDLLAVVDPFRLGSDRLRQALRRLESEEFIRSHGRIRHEFRHALTQETVYESVPAHLRRVLHRQIAEQLERRRQANQVLLAHHYDRAAIPGKAIFYLDAAGRHAQSVYSNQEAIHFYSRAVHWHKKERTRDGLKHLADIFHRRAEVFKNIGRFVLARTDYLSAEKLFLTAKDSVEAANMRDSVGICLQREGNHAEARGHSERALRRLRLAGAPPESMAKCLNSLTVSHWYIGDYGRAIECGEESLRIRRRLKDPESVARGLFTVGNAYTVTCDFPKALARFTELLKIARKIKDMPGIAYALEGIGNCNRRMGNFAVCLRVHRESFRIREKIGNRRSIVYSLLNEAAIYLTMGLPDRAAPRLARAEEFLKETDEENLIGEMWRYRGIAAMEQNRLYHAAICLERALRIAQTTGFRESEVKALSPLAQTTSRLGDDLRAAAICERLNDLARKSRILDYCAWAGVIAGDLAARRKDAALAQNLWRDAIEITASAGLVPLMLEIAVRWRKALPETPLPGKMPSPETMGRRLTRGLDDFDRRAYAARLRVLLG